MTREELRIFNYSKNHKIIDGTIYKLCSTCNNWAIMDEEHFYKWKRISDGYMAQCRICHINVQIVRQKNNIEKKKAYDKEYYKRRQQYYIEKFKKYRTLHPEQCAAATKRWARNNPDKIKSYCNQHRNHDISTAEEKAMLEIFGYACAYCGMTLEEHKLKYGEKLHNDHVDDNGYNDLRNDVPACKSCNCSKHTEDMGTWYQRQNFFSVKNFNNIIWWISEGYKEYIEDKPPYKIIGRRLKKEDGTRYSQNELWTVDERRDIIECIAIEQKKKDLYPIIEKYMEENFNT